MDVITIDIGNSNISLALFTQGKLANSQRVPLSDPGELPGIITQFRNLCGPQPFGARTVPVVASSVNPAGREIVDRVVSDVLDQRILLIGHDVPLPIKIAVEDPLAIGSDRLLNAWAAYSVVEDAVTVADFGTATTIDCVSQQGIFLGGVIMPGLATAAKSLTEHTAALPEVEPELPSGDYGTNTTSAIQHGIYYGAIGALREIVERYANQLGRWPQVVITGGYSKLIAQKCDFIDSLVPDSCLNGLFLAYRQFSETQQENSNKK